MKPTYRDAADYGDIQMSLKKVNAPTLQYPTSTRVSRVHGYQFLGTLPYLIR